MSVKIDCDQHLFETPEMWEKYVPKADRDASMKMVTNDDGYVFLMFGDQQIALAEPHYPGAVDGIGHHRQRFLQGLPSDLDYFEFAAAYTDPKARLTRLDDSGFHAAVLFPNYGITWERLLDDDLRATQVNMAAWNRWIVDFAADGEGRLFPVAHLNLRDADWLEGQLRDLAAGNIRLALIGSGLVDGKPFSHRDLDRVWSAFEHYGISPVFHVANQPRPFADAWYGEDMVGGLSPVAVSFTMVGAALALTDLILNGVFERHPDLRMGMMELGARWVPSHLFTMDGSYGFTSRFNGEATPLTMKPSEYFRRQVRVAAFAVEGIKDVLDQSGDIFMGCSDYPHTEGTFTPMPDYKADSNLTPETHPNFFGGNVGFLLREANPVIDVHTPAGAFENDWGAQLARN
jgi:predicted TIM-barrel fold metal-dependent hydrolase